jgi:oxygen-independent coproporphyrinogen III oxidase
MLELAKRHAAPVPRYTSYPTAAQFTERVGREDATAWLGDLPQGASLSLYTHVPFCAALCWYCACNMNVANRYEPVERYLALLLAEMANVGALVPQSAGPVVHIHWGGGSPSILAPRDILRLAERTRDLFPVSDTAEFAVEIDPRGLDLERVQAFKDAGVNRVSIGVQDFDAAVQTAINRPQSFETTRAAVDMLREAGITGINIDLVYGLPHQTRAGVERTLEQVLSLDPDRVAMFGFAYLPERIRHQRLILPRDLPGPVDRLGQANRVARVLKRHGYMRVGLDHFAKASDTLAKGTVHRNFQGYTSDPADALIGFGASAVSQFPRGFAQNAPGVADYERRIASDGLATVRGVALTQDDHMRGYVIERLMCDLSFSSDELRRRYGEAAAPVIEIAELLIDGDTDGLVEPSADGFIVTEKGRPFVRSISACFDAYLETSEARHSSGV